MTGGFGPLDAVYRRCVPGSSSLLRRVHRRAFTSPMLARWQFGTRIEAACAEGYVADLTTILLYRTLRRRLRRHPGLRVLEIGAGRFAIPAGALSRESIVPIDAVELRPEAVASAQRVIDANGFAVRLHHADVYHELPAARYDLIYWNLPYYSDLAYLRRLVDGTPQRLAAGGDLVVGYNATALTRASLLTYLAAQPRLRVVGVRTWWWNRHEILVARHTMPVADEGGQPPREDHPGGLS
jgi:methylase of polypeptide subunit release factors